MQVNLELFAYRPSAPGSCPAGGFWRGGNAVEAAGAGAKSRIRRIIASGSGIRPHHADGRKLCFYKAHRGSATRKTCRKMLHNTG